MANLLDRCIAFETNVNFYCKHYNPEGGLVRHRVESLQAVGIGFTSACFPGAILMLLAFHEAACFSAIIGHVVAGGRSVPKQRLHRNEHYFVLMR